MALPTYLDAWKGAEAVLGWLKVTHVDDQNNRHAFRFAWEHLGDPITYHGGRKDARVLALNWTRQASDNLGAYRVNALSVTLSDVDQELRRWMGNGYQARLAGALVELYLVSRTDWIAKASPSVVWTGRIDTVDPSQPWTVTLTATGTVDPALLDSTAHHTYIDTTHFPNADTAAIGVVEPIVYGVWGANHPVYGGEWPTVNTGDTVTVGGDPTWRRILVCRHQITSIDSIWLDGVRVDTGIAGGNGILAPGFGSGGTAWPEANSYVDRGGRRYTQIYVNNTVYTSIADGGKLTVALTSGRAASGLLATAAAGQLAHFLDNFVFGHAETTIIASSANTFINGTEKRDTTAFQEASDAAVTDTAWGLTAVRTLRDILTGVCIAGDLTLTENAAGQLGAYEGDATLDVRDVHTDRKDIVSGTFALRQRAIENIHPYTYGVDLVGDLGSLGTGLESRDTSSITAHGERPAQPVDLWAMRDATDAATIVTRRKTRAKQPRHDCSLGVSAAWGQDGVGKDAVGAATYITHLEGHGGFTDWFTQAVALGVDYCWRLGEQPEQSPTQATELVNLQHGTYVGSPQLGIITPVEGSFGGMVFDGSDDRISLGGAISLTSTVTFEFWIRPSSTQPLQLGCIFELSSLNGIYWDKNNNKISVRYGVTVSDNTTAIVPGVWYHVVISINAGSGTFYVNGVADGTFSGYGGYNLIGMGYHTNHASFRLQALGMSDMAIYAAAALTSGNAATLYARRSIDRSARGWTNRAMTVRGMAWDLATLINTYELEEYVNV